MTIRTLEIHENGSSFVRPCFFNRLVEDFYAKILTHLLFNEIAKIDFLNGGESILPIEK
jgi:hypothetical protein